MTIKLLGKTWTVEMVDRIEGDTNMGRMSEVPLQIYLREGMPDDNRDEILLHEMIEAINCEMVLELNEKTVSALSLGLFTCSAVKVEFPKEKR